MCTNDDFVRHIGAFEVECLKRGADVFDWQQTFSQKVHSDPEISAQELKQAGGVGVVGIRTALKQCAGITL